METAKATAPLKFGAVARTVTKILRFRRNAAGSGNIAGVIVEEDEATVHKLKLSHNMGEYYAFLSRPPINEFCKVEQPPPSSKLSTTNEAAESLLANLFASISAIKASYAQLQVAEDPYDPVSIQKSDLAIVRELRNISEIKQSYGKKQFLPCSNVATKIEEQCNLIKTYQITNEKMETDLKHKDAKIQSLEIELLEYEKKNRSLEAKLYSGRSDLYLSGMNPTRFLAALRYTYKAIRSFAKLMVDQMESAGWNLDEAAGAIHPDFLRRKNPADRVFAFEFYVCQKMFSDFHHKSFNLPTLQRRSTWGRRQFFEEFNELMSAGAPPAKWRQSRKLSSTDAALEALSSFYQAKYSSLVAFLGELEHRLTVNTEFSVEFAEMARRVWLLHSLFFSFEEEAEAPSIFQVRRGSRFSEVYMESVKEDSDDSDRFRPDTVWFTVVPGFKVGRMLIQCKVYLSSTVQ